MPFSPRYIKESDLHCLRMAVEAKYGNKADLEAVWAHGADPNSLKFFVVINTHDGSGSPWVPGNAVYVLTQGNTDGSVTSYPGGMNLTVDTAVAHSYTAISALVTDNASAAP